MGAKALGHYELLDKLGSGGMGEVYRAKDLELGREVAIKVLREELASDPDGLKRFEREARTASALNHPNITTIHHVGEHEGARYIAMELVEGKTLRELMKESPLSTKETLGFAKQIAAGLAKAHAAGIVHRDLKPENVMVTDDGLVKILDFGLAKLIPQSSDVDDETATVTKATQHGTILGTVQYMSPEQAAGRAVDFRSDQFSFGSILYEMLTGRTAFAKDTVPQTLAAIIEGEPEPIGKLNHEAPNELLAIVERCLAKERNDRYAETTTLGAELESVPETTSVSRSARRRVLWFAVAAVTVSLVIGLREWVSSNLTSAPVDSIAVLPLRNLSGDPEQEYFADGMTEALMTDLAKIEALNVISRRSIMRYKGSVQPLAEIAEELNVDVLVEGSALRSGDRVRITAQLIDPATEQALWADSYERDLEDVLLLQGEVARAIAAEIRVAVTPEDTTRLAGARPVNPEAYEDYLKGRFHRQKLTEADLDAALSYFQRALEKDPDYAMAYLGISRVWGGRRQMGFATPREATLEGRAAVLKALELDDSLAEAHSALALQKTWGEWDWTSAEQAFERAIQLDPNHAETRAYYAHFLDIMGRPDEATPHAELARELDPLEPLYRALYAVHLTFVRRYDDAIAEFRRADQTAPNQAFALNILTEALHEKRMYEEALDVQRTYFASIGFGAGEEALNQGYAEGGYAAAIHRAADALAARSLETDTLAKIAASLYARAGQNELALDWLERAFVNRDPGLPYLRWPVFDGVRDDPRFRDLLRRMNLPE